MDLPGLRPRMLGRRCAAGAATCRGSSTAPTPACASRSSSASCEVGPPSYPLSAVRWVLAVPPLPLLAPYVLGSGPSRGPSAGMAEGSGQSHVRLLAPGDCPGVAVVEMLVPAARVPPVMVLRGCSSHRLPGLPAGHRGPQVLPGEDGPEAAAARVTQGGPGGPAAAPRCPPDHPAAMPQPGGGGTRA